MALPWNSSSANQYVYASGIASWLTQVVGYDPGLGLQSDPEYYEKFLRDSTVSGAVDHLQKLIVGTDFFHAPRVSNRRATREESLYAHVLDELQGETDNLSQSLYNLAAASWKGAAWGRIYLEKRLLRIGDGLPRVWTVIREVKDIDKRRFRLTRIKVAADGKQVRGVDRAGSVADTWRWEFHAGWNGSQNAYYQPLERTAPREQWILHKVDTSERGLAYGYGLAEDLYFNLFAKEKVLRSLLQGINRWGQGFLYQKVAGLRAGAGAGATPEERIQQAITALTRFRDGNVYALDADDDIGMLDGPADAINACLAAINYFDTENQKRILSAVQTTGAGTDSGSFAKAKVEEGSSDANVAFLRTPLEGDWTRGPTRLLASKNRHNLEALGIPRDMPLPRFRLRGRKLADPEKAALVLTTAKQFGLPLVRREVYDLLELTQPNPWDGPDEVLYPAQVDALQDAAVSAGKLRASIGQTPRKPIGDGGGSVAQDGGERRALRLAARNGGPS